MQMTDCDGESIGSVVRLWDFGQAKQGASHLLYLLFISSAIACYGLLYFHGRVFVHGHFAGCQGHHDYTASLSDLERGTYVLLEKELLHRPADGPVEKEKFMQTMMDFEQALRHGGA